MALSIYHVDGATFKAKLRGYNRLTNEVFETVRLLKNLPIQNDTVVHTDEDRILLYNCRGQSDFMITILQPLDNTPIEKFVIGDF